MNAIPARLCGARGQPIDASRFTPVAGGPDDASMTRETRLHVRLIDWFETHGGRMDSLAFDHREGVRCVRTTVDLADGNEVLYVPRKLIVTLDKAKQSRIGQRLAVLPHEVSDRAYLTAFLLEARRDGGFWSPYVDTLPTAFPGHPILCGPVELTALDRRSAVGGLLIAVRNLYRADFASVESTLAAEHFDRADFDWAYCCVRTRAFSMSHDGATNAALIPLADMLNHEDTPATRHSDLDQLDYVVTALRGTAAGAEITSSYGSFGNAATWSIYGFCKSASDFDRAVLRVGAEPFSVTRQYTHPGMREVLGFLRTSTPLAGCETMPTQGQSPLGVEHERACLDKLLDACRSTLNMHQTCLATDDHARNSPERFPGAARLLEAIESERSVLVQWMTFASTTRRILDAPVANAQDRSLLKHLASGYAAEVVALIEPHGEASR